MNLHFEYLKKKLYQTINIYYVIGACIIYTLLFSVMGILHHETFSYSAYDFGIHIQAIWKLSNFQGFFNTIRGLNIWGDHVWIIMVPIAIFYKFFSHPNFLIVLQAFICSSGAIAVYLISIKKIQIPLYSFIFSLLYLFYPALHNACLESFHPEILAFSFTLFSFTFLLYNRMICFWIFVALSLFCKEDIAIGFVVYGIYIAFFHDKRIGIAVSVISALYFIFSMKIILPLFNGRGFFRFEGGYWFNDLKKNLLNIDFYINTFFSQRAISYFLFLLLPFGFTSLLTPSILSLAFPAIAINIVSRVDYLTSMKYHYEYNILPFLIIASIYGFAKLYKTGAFRPKNMACMMMIFSIISIIIFSNFRFGQFSYLFSALKNERNAIKRHAISLIPEAASVSASHMLVNHLAHRNEIYMFPNPFRQYYWGIDHTTYPKNKDVEFIIVSLDDFQMDVQELFLLIKNEGKFENIFDKDNIVVLRRKQSQILSPINTSNTEENIIINGDFEDYSLGIPISWEFKTYKSKSSKYYIDSGEKISGKCSFMIQHTDLNDSRIVQSLNLLPNTKYLFRGWIKVKNVISEINSGGQIRFEGDIRVNWIKNQIIKGTSDWIQIMAEIITPESISQPSKTYIECRLGVNGDCALGQVWFDNLTLTRMN